eukprot:2081507-Alexandrium_andersonii.AAC.1
MTDSHPARRPHRLRQAKLELRDQVFLALPLLTDGGELLQVLCCEGLFAPRAHATAALEELR